MIQLDEADLAPEVVAMAVPPLKQGGGRVDPILRIKRVGNVYFVEAMQYARDTSDNLIPEWKNVAVAKGQEARREAFEWMHAANAEAIKLSAKGHRAT